MHDASIDVFSWLVIGLAVLGAVVTAVVAAVHFAFFGAIFAFVVKRIGAMPVRPANRRAERRCQHCRSLVSVAVAECPNCGAPAS